MKKIKIGIIGTGVGIRTHLKAFKNIENCEVIAIVGSSKDRAIQFAKQCNIPIACTNYKELCDIDDIDLVCICSPNQYHFDAMKYAISKGKNIICEKPVSHITDEVEKLSLMSKNTDKLIFVDHQLRFNPYMKKIKKIINDDELGKIYLVKINQIGTGFSDDDLPWSWSFDGQAGGGVRLAMASHFNDLIQFWFGNRDVCRVSANLNPIFKNRYMNSEIKSVAASTLCNALLQFKNELSVMYSINAGAFSSFKFDIDIFGDKGELHFDLINKLSIYTSEKKGIKQVLEVDDVFEDERQNKASLFSGSFRYFAPLVIKKLLGFKVNDLENAATLEDAEYNCLLLDAIKKSSNTGTSIVFLNEENNYV